METNLTSVPTVETDLLRGQDIRHDIRTLKSVGELFEDREALAILPPDTPAYEVFSYLPVPEGTTGGLFYGITRIHPLLVGDEYMMTKGHFHAQTDRAEFYWGIRGEGILLMMDTRRHIRTERVSPGSLHYIPGGFAHRMINTGDTLFSFGACWPSDAGHDYETIAREGFPARIKKVNGTPRILKTE